MDSGRKEVGDVPEVAILWYIAICFPSCIYIVGVLNVWATVTPGYVELIVICQEVSPAQKMQS